MPPAKTRSAPTGISKTFVDFRRPMTAGDPRRYSSDSAAVARWSWLAAVDFSLDPTQERNDRAGDLRR
jgi:hypothetical protein